MGRIGALDSCHKNSDIGDILCCKVISQDNYQSAFFKTVKHILSIKLI